MNTMQISDAIYAQNMTVDPYHHNRLAMAMTLLTGSIDLFGKKIFDYGCGEGTFMRLLMERGAIVSGSDVSQELIDLAPAQAAVGSIEPLESLDPDSIDVLVVLNVLGYVPVDEQPRFWKAAQRALRPDGWMLQGNANNFAASSKAYTFTTNPDDFPALLEQHGFTEIARDFHRYRMNAALRPIFGADIINRFVQWMIPISYRRRRSTGYFSLSQKL